METRDPKEEYEQRWVFQWARMNYGKWPELKLLFHVPNGGYRLKSEAARMKGYGVKAGIPDLMLPAARGKYHGLWIEMKKARGGRLTPAQREMQDGIREQGYCVVTCHGWMAAVNVIERYLKGAEIPETEVDKGEQVF